MSLNKEIVINIEYNKRMKIDDTCHTLVSALSDIGLYIEHVKVTDLLTFDRYEVLVEDRIRSKKYKFDVREIRETHSIHSHIDEGLVSDLYKLLKTYFGGSSLVDRIDLKTTE